MIAKHVGWSLLLSYCLCATGLAAETVRVAVVKGVPQIQVNGTPVRARMFWGGTRFATAADFTRWKSCHI